MIDDETEEITASNREASIPNSPLNLKIEVNDEQK